MIPLRDVIPSRTFPFFTISFIVLNSLAFLFEQSLSRPALETLIRTYGVVPVRLDWLSVFTSMFLHGDWMHFLMNMLFLWIFGDNVEDRFGHGRFALFYVICGLAATFAQLAVSAESHIPNVGASGAIAGVLGAYILLFPQGKVRVLQGQRVVHMPAIIVIGLWIALQLFSGIGSIADTAQTGGGVAYMAHVGGFVAGFVLTFVLRGRGEAQALR